MIDKKQLDILNKDVNLNTSYPLSPNDWAKYKIKNYDIFNDINKFSIYVHIPFCKHLCKFCEYSIINKRVIKGSVSHACRNT